MKIIKKIVVGTLLLACLSLVACGNDNTDENELTTVRLNEVVRSVFYAPLYAAIELGFFEEAGIVIELETGQGADRSMTALIANEADIGLMGTEAAIYVYIEGRQDHAMAFAQLTQRPGNFLVARDHSAPFSWENVRGETIIGGRPGGMPQMVLEYVLYNQGIVPGVDVEIITNLAFTTTAGAFIGGIGDFTAEFDPAAREIELSGHGLVVANLASYVDALPYTVFMANKSFIEANPDLIQDFVDAIARGMAWVATATPAQIADVIAPFFPHTEADDLEFIVNRYQAQDSWPLSLGLDRAGFELLQDIMQHGGELSRRVNFDTLVNPNFTN